MLGVWGFGLDLDLGRYLESIIVPWCSALTAMMSVVYLIIIDNKIKLFLLISVFSLSFDYFIMFEVVCLALVLLNFHLSFFYVDLSFSLFGMICVLFHNL